MKSETPFQTLQRRGAPTVVVPVSLNAVGQRDREVYVAKVEKGVRIGERRDDYEVSFVVPRGVTLDKLIEALQAMRGA